MTNMTPAERAAWDAIGHDQTHWTAVKKALAAAAPVYNAAGALAVANILDDLGDTAAADAVRRVLATVEAVPNLRVVRRG